MDDSKNLNQSQDSSNMPSVSKLLFENLLSVDELARDMKRSKLTIYKWVTKGLPKRRIRGRVYFDANEVAQWITRTTDT